jgi:DNA-binding NarL/FixJ family response regulator
MQHIPIKIAITDDHPLIIQGLEKMLVRYKHITITGTYQNGVELFQGLKSNVPQVLLLDIQLPGQTGDELVPELLSQYPGMKIIVLTNFDSSVYASKMLWQGIHGYLLKTSSEDMLMEAIETVFTGGLYVEQSIKQKLDGEPVRSQKFLTEKLSLTTREKEVLQLIVEGYTDKEISERIFLGLSTIKYYRLNLLLKLDVKNTASLVSKALKSGLV